MDIPVAFFAFNRPYHTLETLKSLAKNKEAINTDLYAFIDGHRKTSEIQLIDNVEKIIKSFKGEFRSLVIERSDINLTGGMNQKRGISKVLSMYESVISLEDDIYVSENFLSYMKNALITYRNDKDVWHINAFNYPVKLNGDFDCFFMRLMQCWGWATWKDRWNQFIDNPLSCDPFYLKEIFTEKMKNEFDLNLRRSNFWSQVENNAEGKLNNTWDIFWYSFIFLNNGLCLTPKISLTRNFGHDGSGIHITYDKELLKSFVNQKEINIFPEIKQENKYCINQIRKYLKRKNNLYSKLSRKFNFLNRFYKYS